MEEYSQYSRADLEKSGKSCKQNWEKIKEKVQSACDIEKIGYRLELSDEKGLERQRLRELVF